MAPYWQLQSRHQRHEINFFEEPITEMHVLHRLYIQVTSLKTETSLQYTGIEIRYILSQPCVAAEGRPNSTNTLMCNLKNVFAITRGGLIVEP